MPVGIRFRNFVQIYIGVEKVEIPPIQDPVGNEFENKSGKNLGDLYYGHVGKYGQNMQCLQAVKLRKPGLWIHALQMCSWCLNKA